MSRQRGDAASLSPDTRVHSHAGTSAETVLATLRDDSCRQILSQVWTEAHCADELADQLDLPLSTIYRKLDQLTDADLVAERPRINPSGKHRKEYVRIVEDVDVNVVDDGGIEVTVRVRESRATAVSD